MKNGRIIFQIAAAALIIFFLCLCISAHKKTGNQKIIYNHRNEYHRVIQSLFDKKIVGNQSAENLIKKYPPTKISIHDNYQTIQYFNEDEEVEDCCVVYSYYIHIIARNERLVKAFATEGFFAETDYVFFDVMDGNAENAYWDSRMQNAVTAGKN